MNGNLNVRTLKKEEMVVSEERGKTQQKKQEEGKEMRTKMACRPQQMGEIHLCKRKSSY